MSADNKEKLIYKIKNSVSCSCLFALEEDFNKVGLTLQTTNSNRTILCRVEDGRPITENAIEDYIFVGNSYEDKELGQRTIDCVVEFVDKHAGDEASLRPNGKSYHKDVNLYGNEWTAEKLEKFHRIVLENKINKVSPKNEDINFIAEEIDG